MTREKSKAVETVRELTVLELEQASAGLNPQPLPPGRYFETGIHFLNPQPLPPG